MMGSGEATRGCFEIVADGQAGVGPDAVKFVIRGPEEDSRDVSGGVYAYSVEHEAGGIPRVTLKAWMPTARIKVSKVTVMQKCPVCGTEKEIRFDEGAVVELTTLSDKYRVQWPKAGLAAPVAEEGEG